MILYRVTRLYQRFRAQNLRINGPLPASGAARRGQVTRYAMIGNRLHVEGVSTAPLVSLHCGTDTVSQRPGSAAPGTGFALDLPQGPGALSVQFEEPGHPPEIVPLRAPAAAARRWAEAKLVAQLLRRLITALPLIWRWRQTRDPALRADIRAALGLWVQPATGALQEALFDLPQTAVPAPRPEVTAVIPVYNGFDLLPEVLDRFARNSDLPWHLILIEDASPDPQVLPYLRDWVAARAVERPGAVTLIENAENLGFVASANRGLALAATRGGPVLLINADAMLPEGYASRMIAPLMSDPQIASVTPMSNEAEIFTAPVICQGLPLRPGMGDAIDRHARNLSPAAASATVPTGVGFCMAMSADWLRRVPQFDMAFHPGYGEEVDWCQQVIALGGRHLGLGNVFVEHRGGASFGSVKKQKLIAGHAALIAQRHPGFDSAVQQFLAEDPLASPRLALGLAWAAQEWRARDGGPLPIYLCHAMGGGVEMYQTRRIAQDIARGGAAVVLRVGGRLRWRLELHCAQGVTRGETESFALIEALLAPLRHRHILYACAVADRDPVSVPAHLLRLIRDSDQLEILFHDFLPLSPSFTLLSADQRFHGVPGPEDRNPAHQFRRADGTEVPLSEWRAAWGALADRADRLTVFSQDSRQHVLTAWPQHLAKLCVTPHQLHHPVPMIEPVRGTPPVIAVLGNLNSQKGSALIAEMQRQLSRDTEGLSLVVIGDFDPAAPRAPGLKVHGPYTIADVPVLTRRYRVQGWLIPSIWPETFSYTTHEALATGLPVYCLDLGAQAEALRAAGQGDHVIALHQDPAAQAAAVIARLRKDFS
ncbi:glycosyltransferase [Phaeovulum sp. W22_SRMD_FR3]|uniref:glycosyltransferase n=1 Tax=Phaeovulum sp. W22_SRMD_FR3 TaxID=3240274 RepID=UPI003F982FBE